MNQQEAFTNICLVRGAEGLSTDTRIAEIASILVNIEKLAHADAWSEGMYLEEFNSPHATILLALEKQSIQADFSDFSDRAMSQISQEPIEYPFQTSSPILGFCCLRTLFEVSEIRNIIVHPQHQGRGVGTSLLAIAGREAKKSGAEELTLEVRESNTKARCLYQKLGFKVAGNRPGYYRDNNEAAIIMTLGFESRS